MNKKPGSEANTNAGTDGLAAATDWIFDLDNTLYPSSCNLFAQVDRRMGEFISRHLSLDAVAAKALQKQYFREHGTTLRGLMRVHRIDAQAFLDYVHDIDLSVLPPQPGVATALAALSGRKLVFTNGSHHHAQRVLERLGIADQFAAIVDIVASDFIPKPEPEPYHRLVERFALDTRATIMVEDIAVNLAPAHALGMTTVWLRSRHDWCRPPEDATYVSHEIDDLEIWLTNLAASPPADG